MNSHRCVKVRDAVCNSRDLFDGIASDRLVELDRQFACYHGTETSEVDLAGVYCLAHNLVSVGRNGNVKNNVALN